ncbi:MAG: hypothetical protein IJ105_04350 [Bacilli bacterium]|nr:hypothetical protein [Bacilli bacterium]
MKQLDEKQMKQISAGAINGTLLNAILRGVNVFIDAGRNFGSAIRRLTSRNLCR